MNELQVFLVSEIGEICVGTVDEIINRTIRYPEIDRLLMDLVGDMISQEVGGLRSTITVDLRDPTGE